MCVYVCLSLSFGIVGVLSVCSVLMMSVIVVMSEVWVMRNGFNGVIFVVGVCVFVCVCDMVLCGVVVLG